MPSIFTAIGQNGDQPGVAPAVSVIVPCYNGGRFIAQLLSSLAGQTFRDFETVVVDDGSTDADTMRALAALPPDMRVIRQDNAGPSAARNTGLRAARGDLVFMLDCDDAIEPSFLAETVPLLQQAGEGVAVAFTHLRLVGAEFGDVPRYFNRFDLLFTNTLSSGLVARKAACLAVGGYDETMRDGYEDWEFSLRLAEAGYRGIEVPKPLYIYHIGAQDERSRSSNIDRNRLYGKLWRDIRDRHKSLYRLPSLVQLWLKARGDNSRVPLWKGLAAHVLALILPDSLFNQLVARLHRRHRADRAAPAYSGSAAEARFVS